MSVVALAAGTHGPRLRSDIAIVEQVFRGETSFVVKDPTTHKYFRFRPVEVGVMRCFDGRRSPDEIAAALAEQGSRLTGKAVEAFARKLTSIGLLEHTLTDRTTLELERLRAERRRRRRPALFRGELLRMRWSFGDPDALLDRVMPWIRWMFTPAFVIASIALFAAYFLILAATWSDFSRTVVELYSLSTIAFGTIVVLWLTGIVVVVIHELGHGFTCKHFGGEVHELGVMVLYFQPAFYCNVNDAWSFPSLRSRLWVTAAGGWIQLVVASLAAIVWLVARPGTLASEVAVAAMIVGGATTIVTNANPLLPLDGYFALIDWLEIPNLRIRAREYFGWWVRRHTLRLELPEPEVTDRERRVFLIYGALSFVYVVGLLGLLTFWVAGRAHQALGAIGAFIVIGLVLTMARRGIASWSHSVALAIRARRAERTGRRWWRGLSLAASGLVLLLAVLPWTLTTTGRFVVSPARVSDVTAPDSGIIAAVYAREGMHVAAGAPLARLIDRDLERALLSARRAVDSLGVASIRTRAAGGMTEQLEAERAEAIARMAAVQSRLDALTLRAPFGGVVVTPRVHELYGHRVTAGDAIMRIAMLDSLEARIAVTRAGVTAVRPGQVVHLMAYEHSRAVTRLVGFVAPAGAGSSAKGTIEVRVPIGASTSWRAGVTGEASVELRRATALAALWWNVRQRIRGDVLL
jgi:putative peptide zinc metalloprotease protein